MRTNLSIASAALLAFASSARASSPIPSNYVDDFGPIDAGASAETTPARPSAHASPIASNYVDDFGSTDVSTSSAATPAATRPTAHASPIASNYVDDFGLDAPSTDAGAVGAANDSVQTALNQPSSRE